MPNVLIAFYSYTQQTRNAAEQIACGVEAAGHSARLARIEFADGPLEFPLRRPLLARANELCTPGRKEVPTGVTFDESIVDTNWDLVLIGSPTWNHFPAWPISSFLQTPAAHQILHGGTPFGAFLVCRGFWRINRKRVRRLGERAGGRFVGGQGFTFDGHLARTMHTFFHSQLTGADPDQKLLGIRAARYGLSDATLARARDFGRATAAHTIPTRQG